MTTTAIEWATDVWNPTRGCVKISPGCAHCYAHTFSERFRDTPGHPYEFGFDFRIVPHKLSEPLRWTKPKVIFANSMSDVFFEQIPFDYLHAMCDVMVRARHHIFQVLTKRSSRMQELLNGDLEFAAKAPNIWWGVSVENQKHGLPRIDHLREVRAAHTRFLSVEPLLEDLGRFDLSNIHWVIVGGESGLHLSRPNMKAEWAVNVYNHCHEFSVPFFFKQWGGRTAKSGGREFLGRTWDLMPTKQTKPITQHELHLHRKAIDEVAERFTNHPLAWKPSTN